MDCLPEGSALLDYLPRLLEAQRNGRSPFQSVQYTVAQAQGLELTKDMLAEAPSSLPGTRIGHILRSFLTHRAYRRYVYPAIAEMQAEYFEALAAGQRGHARWIAIRGHVLLIPGWLYGLVAQAIRRVFST
jgi:hypothetical protein